MKYLGSRVKVHYVKSIVDGYVRDGVYTVPKGGTLYQQIEKAWKFVSKMEKLTGVSVNSILILDYYDNEIKTYSLSSKHDEAFGLVNPCFVGLDNALYCASED